MDTIIVSDHARKRIKERCGIGKSKADRMCSLAMERGIERENTKGILKKWLSHRYTTDETGKIIVYGDKVYVFSQNVCITVLQIPAEITRNMKKMFAI